MTAIYKAISAVQSDLAKTGIKKDGKNTTQHYKFRGIDAVYSHLAPLLSKHGLVILPRVMSRECVERKTAKGGNLFYTILDVEFDMVATEDGSKHTIRTIGEAMDSADKSTNKAMSAAYKYACFLAFCIPTEGDNDADGTTHDVAPRQTKPQAVQNKHDPRVEVGEQIKAIRIELGLSGMQVSQAYGLPAENATIGELQHALNEITDLHTAWHNGQLTEEQKAIMGVTAA